MKSAFLLLCSFAVLSACNDDKKDNPTPASSRTDLLTAKNWRITATTVTLTGSSNTVDGYANFLPCNRDNFTKFNPDRTMLNDEGPSKCDAADPQTETASWAFSQDEKQLLFGIPGNIGIPASPANSVPFTIVELSATTLHLRTDYNRSGVLDLTFTAF